MARPSGLRRSEAILARSLFGAMPIEQVKPVFSLIPALILEAIISAVSDSSDTSKNTSSIPAFSITGVIDKRTDLNC